MKSLNKEILRFWEKKGSGGPSGKLVTHKDKNQVSMEIKTVLELLRKNDVLLDVGCGNGFATSIYAKKCSKTVGLDFSKSMIKSAREAHGRKNLIFEEGDVISLKYDDRSFSVILSTRCLINLTSWRDQKTAILNMHRVLEANGRLILIEGIKQGRENLNVLRMKMGLCAMPKVWHNRDLDWNKLTTFLKGFFVIKQDIRFGLYDVFTRVYYPAAIHPRDPVYGINYHFLAEKLYFLLERDMFSSYGREACLVLVKK